MQNVFSLIQNLRGLPELVIKVDGGEHYSLFLNLAMTDLILSFIVDTIDLKNGLLVRCHCLWRIFYNLLKILVL
jgi:hypothetical protein